MGLGKVSVTRLARQERKWRLGEDRDLSKVTQLESDRLDFSLFALNFYVSQGEF